MPVRSRAYGQGHELSIVDRFVVWLSALAVNRNAAFAGKHVADFGCGYQATLARRILPDVGGLVLFDVHIAEDLKRHPKVRAIDGLIEAVLPTLPSESLDIVLCLSVLEHLDDPQQALDGFRRILAPGGVALINVPSWRGKGWLELWRFALISALLPRWTTTSATTTRATCGRCWCAPVPGRATSPAKRTSSG